MWEVEDPRIYLGGQTLVHRTWGSLFIGVSNCVVLQLFTVAGRNVTLRVEMGVGKDVEKFWNEESSPHQNSGTAQDEVVH